MTAPTGEVGTSAWRNQNSGQDYDNTYSNYLAGLQARYFSNRLVIGVGYRTDTLKSRQYAQTSPTNGFNLSPLNERVIDYTRWDDTKYSGQTKTHGVVYHVTSNFRLMYNGSDNFGQPSTSRREYPNNSAPRKTQGIDQDYGIGFSLLNNRISGRLTRFQTDSKNIYIAGYNLQDTQDALLNALVSATATTGLTREQADKRRILGTGGIMDQHVEGYEFSLTLNITRNWRLIGQYSHTDGYQTNSYPDQREYVAGDPNGRLGGNDGLTFFEKTQWADLPLVSATSSTVGEYIANFKRTLAEDLAALGKNRPNKASLFTRYSFEQGPLKALSLGGGARFQDREQLGVGKNAAGQAIPLSGTRYLMADFMASYGFKRLLGLRQVSLQLNINNVLGFDDYLVTARNPTTGTPTRISFLQPRAWRLSANFEF